MHRIVIIFISSLLLATQALAISAEDAIRQSRELAGKKKYTEALGILEKASAEHPEDIDIKLSMARVQSWQGNYDAAEKILGGLGKKASANPDAMLLRANLAYYKQDFTGATALYKKILAKHPDYKDARTGLVRAEKAMRRPTPERNVVESPVEAVLAKTRHLAAEQQYDEALALLQETTKTHPGNLELKLAIVRVLCWQGNFQEAEKTLDTVDTQYNTNPDVMLLRANLSYYRQDYTSAMAQYAQILAAHPGYVDANAGRERAQKAMNAPENKHYRWKADTGYEHSSFSRVNQPSWNLEFFQLTHYLANNKTALHGKVMRYDQFSNIDTEFEIGVHHRFADYLNAYAFTDITPNPDFRPNYLFAGGGAVRVVKSGNVIPPVWLTLDSTYSLYENLYVVGVNPGLSIGLWDGWSLSGKMITAQPQGTRRIYGKGIRLDGTVIEGIRFYMGYSNAPDTENGITVRTTTYSGGIAADVTPEITVRVDYARDDRQNSYIKEGISTSVSYRF